MLRSFVCSGQFRIRVSGLPYKACQSEVMNMFSSYGPTDCQPVLTETGKDLGQSLVSFQDVESAIRASEEMDGKFFIPINRPPKSMIDLRRISVACDFRGPRIVEEVHIPREPHPRRLIKKIRDKAVGAGWPTEPVMANTNESRMIRRYKTGGLPRSHDRQR
jgi:hypothetical protein